jgi:hypothetical protein
MLKMTWGEPKEEPIKLLRKGPSAAIYHHMADVAAGKISGIALIDKLFGGSVLYIYGGVLGDVVTSPLLQVVDMAFRGGQGALAIGKFVSAGIPTWYKLVSITHPDCYFIGAVGSWDEDLLVSQGTRSIKGQLFIIDTFKLTF